jgi:tetraacyldisaccharide 4'-kinase
VRRTLERLEQFAVDVILERRYGKRAAFLRGLLYLLSLLYQAIVTARIGLYNNRLLQRRSVGCLVVSVGNLTVGGTGKTPVVELVARSLRNRGRRVAILSRGYKSKRPPLLRRLQKKISSGVEPPRIISDGHAVLLDAARGGDEPHMLAQNLPGVIVLTDRDRVKAATYALERWDVDTFVLDDGMQYLPLYHRYNIILIDSQAPFANGHLLPRGLLREPKSQLKRADLIILTKCQADSSYEELIAEIRQYNSHAPILTSSHLPCYLEDIYTGQKFPLTLLNGRRIGAISGIARPESFEGFLKKEGAELIAARRYADHHRYSRSEVLSFIKRCRQLRIKYIITTEKDAVRFPPVRENDRPIPILFLRVEIRMHEPEAFERALDEVLGKSLASAALC